MKVQKLENNNNNMQQYNMQLRMLSFAKNYCHKLRQYNGKYLCSNQVKVIREWHHSVWICTANVSPR